MQQRRFSRSGPGFPELPPQEGPWASAPNVFPRADERNPSFPPRPVESEPAAELLLPGSRRPCSAPRADPFDPRVPHPVDEQAQHYQTAQAQAATQAAMQAQAAPATDRTVTMGPPGHAAPPQQPTAQHPQMQTPQQQMPQQTPPQGLPAQPSPQAQHYGPTTGEHLVQQLPHDDPYKPFVTAGQISGPKTPPAARQQELWNTVWGDGQHTTDDDEDDEKGKPVWLFALVGSVLVALIVALLWAFLAGPLSSAAETTAQPAPRPSRRPPSRPPSAPAQGTASPTYEGEKSAVKGDLTDDAAGISISMLGGQWKTDADTQTVKATYGYTTRQYVSAGLTSKGKPWFATVSDGPAARRPRLAVQVADRHAAGAERRGGPGPEHDLPQAQQGRQGRRAEAARRPGPGRRLQGDRRRRRTLVVVAAVNTGAEVPSIVYMQIPDLRDDLLPDVNTILDSIKKA